MYVTSKFYEDYVLGDRRETMGRTITESDLVIHAGQTGDFFPHHMDAEWCKTQSFKRRISHGTLTFSIGIGMTANQINPEAFSKGYDRLRFLKPVFIGDTIHTVVTISNKVEVQASDFGEVIENVEIFNQKGELVLVCEHILKVRKVKK